MSKLLSCLVLISILSLPELARADVILDILGSPGSSTLSITASGSITYDTAAGPSGLVATNSTLLRFPGTANAYLQVGNNIGNFLGAGWSQTASTGERLTLSSSTLELTGSGAATFSFSLDEIRFDDDTGTDDLDLLFNSGQPYPQVLPDSGVLTMELSGTATFTLANSNTFDDLITGTYTDPVSYGDQSDQTVSLRVSAVPEPNGFVLVGTAIIAGLTRQRKRSLSSLL